MANFNQWLDTFVKEKGLRDSQPIQVEILRPVTEEISLGDVVEAIKQAPEREQRKIHKLLIVIDCRDGDLMPFIRELAKAAIIDRATKAPGTARPIGE